MQHIRRMVKQPAPLRVVHALCGREPAEPVARHGEHLLRQLPVALAGKGGHGFPDLIQHFLPRPRRGRHQLLHGYGIPFRRRAPLLDPQLKPSVVFLHQSPDLDGFPGLREFLNSVPVPDLCVDLPASVPQVHIHVVASVPVRLLLGAPHKQKALEAAVPDQLANPVILHICSLFLNTARRRPPLRPASRDNPPWPGSRRW